MDTLSDGDSGIGKTALAVAIAVPIAVVLIIILTVDFIFYRRRKKVLTEHSLSKMDFHNGLDENNESCPSTVQQQGVVTNDNRKASTSREISDNPERGEKIYSNKTKVSTVAHKCNEDNDSGISPRLPSENGRDRKRRKSTSNSERIPTVELQMKELSASDLLKRSASLR